MQKKNDVDRKDWQRQGLRLVTGMIGGCILIALSGLLFAGLILAGVLPPGLTGLYAGIAMFLGGAAASLCIGRQGKILLYVPAVFAGVLAVLFLLGEALFGGVFAPGEHPWIAASLLLGALLGSCFVNLR